MAIKAGCVVVTKFCGSNSAEFGNYINYIDREDAVRNEYISKYNLYNDYMGNPDKTSGIFCNGKIDVNTDDIKRIKEIFSIAQENGSLMWQTVISFDNRWLKENGIFSPKDNFFDEDKIKEITTGAINKMLEREHLQNAVWSGAIHFNTDNIHVHVATVEPQPMREIKSFPAYRYIIDPNGWYTQDRYGKWIHQTRDSFNKKENDGLISTRYRKERVLDEDGKQVYLDEPVGRFKQESIEICKSHVVNEIIRDKSYTLEINNIIRNTILKNRKNNPIANDREFVDKFLEIHNELIQLGPRKVWNYGSSEIASVIPQIDDLSKMYLKKNEPVEYRVLQSLIQKQSEMYSEAYGDNKEGRLYQRSKNQDLLYRMGNSILKELRTFDNSSNKASEHEYMQEYPEEYFNMYINAFEQDLEQESCSKKDFWENYVAGKELLKEGRLDEAFEKFQLALKGDQIGIANYQLGKLYSNHNFSKYNMDKSVEFFKICIKDYELPIAMYWLGKIHLDPNSNYYNYDEGVSLLQESASRSCSVAEYRLGRIYLDKDSKYYNKAEGMDLLERAATKRIQPARYLLAKEYLDESSLYYNPDKGIEYLEECAASNFGQSKFLLANLYINPDKKFYNPEKGLNLLKECADEDNQFAQVKLGVIYSSINGSYPGIRRDLGKATYYLTLASDNGNDYAKHRLQQIVSNKATIEQRKRQYDVEKAMRALKKSFDSEVSKRRNIREYERLNSQGRDKDQENELEN